MNIERVNKDFAHYDPTKDSNLIEIKGINIVAIIKVGLILSLKENRNIVLSYLLTYYLMHRNADSIAGLSKGSFSVIW